MIVPAILLIISLLGALASLLVWGPVLDGPMLLALLSAVAAVILLLRGRTKRARAWIVVDGSNVLHWDGEVPAIATVARVVDDLRSRGFVPVVWFDANVGYRIGDRYMGPESLARALDLPARQIFVAPKGTPADPLLLEGAVVLNARVVTNDRFRDWTNDHPKILEPGFLVPGQVRDGSVTLTLQDTGSRRRA
jgi:hypothetical protein